MQTLRAVSLMIGLGLWTTPPSWAETVVENPAGFAQIKQTAVTEIINIEIQQTADGLTLQMETDGELSVSETVIEGNRTITQISNAVLAQGEEFFASNPIEGIASVQVTPLDNNQVQIAIAGTDTPPTVDIRTTISGITVSVTPDLIEPIELVVIPVAGEDYFVPNASTATRTDTSILKVPQSIAVIPEEVLADQQVTDIDEALRNLSGVAVDSTEGRGFKVSLRGFDGVPVLRDGFRLYSPNDNGDGAGQSFPEIANIERIEVLRGLASVLYGQTDPGGAVNVVSKQPLAEPFAEVALQGGNYGFVRPRIDLSGPLTEDDTLLYRLNAVYSTENGFRDFEEDTERFFISPALTWNISNRTNLNLRLEYFNDDRPFDTGLVAFGDEVADIPRDRVLGEPDDEISSDYLNVGYTFEHEFSENWQLRNAFRYIRDEDDINAVLSFPFIGGLDETTGTLNRVFAGQEVVNETNALQTNVIGGFNTGSIDHKLLLGLDLARYELESDSFTNFAPPFRTTLNIFDPVYGQVPRPDRADEPSRSETINTDSLLVYLQDQIDITDELTVVAGFSYETVDQENILNDESETLEEDAFNPRIGVIYQPVENISLYANYSQSFLPNSGTTIEGDPLQPEAGEGFEIGVKTELLNQNLLATLAYFNLTKRNVATADLTDPRFSVATGEQQSEGIELDVSGEILLGWNIIASYSYIDAEITEDNQFKMGNSLAGVPEHSASLWTTYQIQSGNLEGLELGFGFNWVGARQGDLSNSFELDPYFVLDAAVSYQRENWQFALNLKNLFDTEYIVGTPRTRTRGIEPGDPFTIIGSFNYQF
ncbi:TonB-dependent siderophore receptor [Halothece sp. PCC 7418]|uniref:TonB-dependent siderophore receptor n=1 Tax=Halothece sp. (strain PCC 7418) TaxID=65093 RepID=UPI0002A08A0D|nr:TonB-dependent siderophore receptor [Halothece sp. PCC 7418]AFZ42414.1 TonB-dependent siderophore receptor [Halothece sp. PCC 7418]